MAVDIDHELQVIRTQAGGEVVKEAISSALSKCAEARGGSIVKELQRDKATDFSASIDDKTVAGIGTDYYPNPIIKITFTKKRGSNTYGQVSEFYFYDSNENRIALDVQLVIGSKAAYQSNTPDKALDGDTSTKWQWTWANPSSIEITLNQSVTFAYFSYVTGNDYNARDPLSFTINYYDGSVSKEVLSVTNASITTARTTETQKFACDFS